MLLREVDQGQNVEKLAAISQFLLGRAKDVDSTKKTISFRAFANLAQGQGISLTPDLLKKMIMQPPLSNLIMDVQGDDENAVVVFKGSETAPPTMSVDQARATVNKMAKRALP